MRFGVSIERLIYWRQPVLYDDLMSFVFVYWRQSVLHDDLMSFVFVLIGGDLIDLSDLGGSLVLVLLEVMQTLILFRYYFAYQFDSAGGSASLFRKDEIRTSVMILILDLLHV